MAAGEPPALREVMRTSATVREFRDEPVSDEALFRILDDARFAPSGGNRQPWRLILVKNAATRARLRELYASVHREFVALSRAGLVGFAGVYEPEEAERLRALLADLGTARSDAADGLGWIEDAPVLIIVCADLRLISATDKDLPRPGLVAGASVYAFVQNVLLAARAQGLGGVLTTLITRQEPVVKELLGIPEPFAVAAMLAIGRPVRQLTKLRRRPVEELVAIDRFDGPEFGLPEASG